MNRRLRPPPRSKPRAVPEYVPPPRPPASGAQAAFRGKIDSVRTLAVVLRCVAFRPKCVVTANSEGLFFTVDDARCARARAYFPEKLFRRWTFADGTAGPAEVGPDGEELRPELRFEINLFTLMECLNIYGTALSGSAAAGDGAAGASRQSVPGDGRGGPSKEARTTPLEIWFESSEKKLCLA